MKNFKNSFLGKSLIIVFLFIPFFTMAQTVQQRLDSNETPKLIFNSGVPLDSLYGKTYQGGLIFYMDTVIGNGLVCAPSDQSTGAQWGCSGTSIEGTSDALYAGHANTNAIVAGCSDTGIAAKLCYDLVLNSYSDWYLPSQSELVLMYVNLYLQGHGGLSGGGYWTSTQYESLYALMKYFFNGNPFAINKNNSLNVRAIRCFCSPNTCPCQVTAAATHELVQWEIFKDKMAPDFSTLKNTDAIPSQTFGLDSLNVKNLLSTLDYFSSRIRGYLIPPVSGNYYFYFNCDDAGQFWLSTDTSSANAVLKSQIDSIQTDSTQNVSTQTLVAGEKYFFELLHYDSVYTNMTKLAWQIPGDSLPVTITSSYMTGYYDGIEVSSLEFVKDTLLVYPNWFITPQYYVKPWNAAYKTVIWKSSNNAIATVNIDGIVTTVSPGTCEIIAMSALNTTLTDTLHLTVSDYYGPFFIKQNASVNGDGHSWDNAIQLTKLLDMLNQGTIAQQINVYIAEGTYKPTTTIDRNKTFLLNNLRMVGGFDSTISGTDTLNRDFENIETILSGEIGIPGETMDNSYHVVITKGNVTIDGLTIRDGRANCRSYGDDNNYEFSENQGGGIFINSLNTYLLNCKITHNSAFNSGGGIFGNYVEYNNFYPYSTIPKVFTMENCIINDNIIQQNIPIGGGGGGIGFIVVVNGYGPAFYFQYGTINMKNCLVYGNSTPNLQPVCRFSSSIANVDNCSFFNNTGTSDLGIWGQATLNMNNSTVDGPLITLFNGNAYVKNSTITGGGYFNYGPSDIFLDNSIWAGMNLTGYPGTNEDSLCVLQAKYSILGNYLVGANKDSIISDSIPNYSQWLDTLAYNGGFAPTMKLKNVPFNAAISSGNPLYLDSLDQRGVLRKDSVSIGAYQWVSPIPQNQIDSVDWEIFENQSTYNFATLKDTTAIPDKVVKLTSLLTPNFSTNKDHFASRIRGYLIPPFDGNYSFYFNCDDAGQFWLSTDTSSANAVLKSHIDSLQVDTTQNVSSQILVAGQKYFFEILQYDVVYTDMIKLRWVKPGDTIPEVIPTPYVVSSGENIQAASFSLIDHKKILYPNWTITAGYHLTPWNVSDNQILWISSNTSIAIVNDKGEITSQNPGICQIIGWVAMDSTLTDTMQLTVTTYYEPYFVKQNASPDSSGHSWDNAINFTTLLDILNQGRLTQQVSIFIAEGVYKPTNTIDRTKSFVLNQIRLIGGYDSSSTGTDTLFRDYNTNLTILSGEIGDQGNTIDNSYHVVRIFGSYDPYHLIQNNYTIIDGINIRDGRASCSSYGFNGWGFTYNDNGGGIFAGVNSYFQSGYKIDVINCKINNNSAWNSGGGIYITRNWTGGNIQFSIKNSSVFNNTIQQQPISTGGWFVVVINGHGGGISNNDCSLYLNNCLIFDNHAVNNGGAIQQIGGNAIIESTSIFNNQSDNWPGIGLNYSTTMKILKSSIKDNFYCASSSANIINSTIVGNLISDAIQNYFVILDNSIWTDLNSDTSKMNCQNSILNNNLYGSSKNDLISSNVPNYLSWLDTLAYNGGFTPTMKLKNVPFNPARSNGNPLYLDSLDQRGAIRSDSVSIGAYQWVKATDISISPTQITLCQGDSMAIIVSVLPAFVSRDDYIITSSNNTVAYVNNSKIYALAPGNVDIIVQAVDGGFADTCSVIVMDPVGSGVITGDSIVCQGQTSGTYIVTGISNATSSFWTLPDGAAGTSLTSSITVDFSTSAISGDITVKGTNTCGDGPTSTLAIAVKIPPTSTGTPSEVSCFGFADGEINTTVIGGTQPYYFSWSDGESSEDLYNLSAGIYTCTISDANGCTGGLTFTVVEPPALNLSSTITGSSCFFSDGIIESLVNGGSPPYNYVWSTGGSAQNLAGLSPGAYALTISDINDCALSDTFMVAEPVCVTQYVNLQAGWGIMSTYIIPENPQVEAVFAPVLSSTILVKNAAGQVWWPFFNLNMIGNMMMGQGYRVKMSTAQVLPITGIPVVPELSPLSLSVGWNLIAYLRQAPADISIMLSTINSSLIVAKNSSGAVYWPYFNMNFIGNMNPGEGYQIRTNASCNLTYPSNTINYSKSEINHPQPIFFGSTTNTGNNMTLGILIDQSTIHPGDEIGVFSQSGLLVGAAVVEGDFAAITLWGDDDMTPELDGLLPDEMFSIQVYRNQIGVENMTNVIWLEGDGYFQKDKIAVVGIGETISTNRIMLSQNQPNPFTHETEFSFYLPEKTQVEFTILNLLGETLEILINEKMEAGKHSLKYQTKSLSAGSYYYKLETPDFNETRRMMIIK